MEKSLIADWESTNHCHASEVFGLSVNYSSGYSFIDRKGLLVLVGVFCDRGVVIGCFEEASLLISCYES